MNNRFICLSITHAKCLFKTLTPFGSTTLVINIKKPMDLCNMGSSFPAFCQEILLWCQEEIYRPMDALNSCVQCLFEKRRDVTIVDTLSGGHARLSFHLTSKTNGTLLEFYSCCPPQTNSAFSCSLNAVLPPFDNHK